MLHQSLKTRQDRPSAHTAARALRRPAEKFAHDDQPWQERAISAQSNGARDAIAALQTQLADRIAFLTGRKVATDAVYVNPAERFAVATVDGAVFRLQQGNLVLLRPCAYCGTGHFASAPIESLPDLGHALAVWQPFHADCEPSDPAEFA